MRLLLALYQSTVEFFLGVNGCQVDRHRKLFLRGLHGTVFSLFFTSVACGVETNTSDSPVKGPLGVVWEAAVEETGNYEQAVSVLFEQFEEVTDSRIVPGDRGKVALKLNSRSGRGLATPLPLVRAIITALESRGFSRDSILILDRTRHALHRAGVLSFSTGQADIFEECPVLALDTEKYFDENWFYDSPLPPVRKENPSLFNRFGNDPRSLDEGDYERKSFLPMPLIEEVDFWINLATAVDDPVLGIDGAMASATLWNVGNSQRFLANDATASAALAEIAAIPELRERLLFHCVSLERYQYIGGPLFNSRYSESEAKLWLSSDAVAIDRLLLERMNYMRVLEGFPRIAPLPRQFPFAVSLGLGVDDLNVIQVRQITSSRTLETH